MKILVRTLIISFFFLLNLNLFSQNLYNYSLYNQNPETYNPSTITDDNASFYLMSKIQWVGVDGFPKYNSLGASFSVAPEMRLGVSMLNITHGVFNNFKAKINYAYKIKFSNSHYLNAGVSAGIVNNKLLFSQIENVDLTDNLLQPNNYNKTSLTFAFGISYKLNQFEAQFILPQLYEYNEINLYGIGIFSYNFFLNRNFKLKPSVLVKNTELNKIQSDAILNLEWRKRMWIQFGARTDGSLIFGVGNQTIGYAYEAPTNLFSGITVGTHEILLRFRIKPSQSCPAYYDNF